MSGPVGLLGTVVAGGALLPTPAVGVVKHADPQVERELALLRVQVAQLRDVGQVEALRTARAVQAVDRCIRTGVSAGR